VFLDHGSGHTFLEAAHEYSSFELVFLLFVVAGVDGEGTAHVGEVVGGVADAGYSGHSGWQVGGRLYGGGEGSGGVGLLGVQLFHVFLVVETIIIA